MNSQKTEVRIEILARNHVQNLLLRELDSAFLFHNFDHAVEVSEVAAKLADTAELDAMEKEMLVLAGWFHDTGYTSKRDGHEQVSAMIAEEFLNKKGYPEKQIEIISDLIKSTHKDHLPQTTLEKILHDANVSYLGRKRFFRRSRLLRMETEQLEGRKFTLYDWGKRMLELQIGTKFHTPWAVEEFSKRRNKNIAQQREDLVKAKKTTVRKKTGKDFGRGVDTVYRVALRNHINLSSIADGKANMIISINTLVLSILITAGSAGFSLTDFSLQENLNFILPVLLLMITSLIAIIFAVLSAIPKISSSKFDESHIRDHKVSLLYFGNFLKLNKERFVEYLRDLKKDQELLYDDLSRDLYNLGVVLDKKYRLLTIAYRVFVGGLALSVIVFLLATLILN